jgi:hypothetical protein
MPEVLTCNYATILVSSHYAIYNLQCLYLYATTNQLTSPLCKVNIFFMQNDEWHAIIKWQ